MKILFQGDSITDAGRDRRNYHHLGYGYPLYAAENIKNAYGDKEFEFINFGISGNRTSELFDRLYVDGIAFQPDVISVLIGINDICNRYGPKKILTTDEQIEVNYRSILERIKNETNAKIVMIAPYLFDSDTVDRMRGDLERLLVIVEKLAKEYADVFIPLNKIFDEALKTQPTPKYYSADGVHPNEEGSKFIGEVYAKYVAELIK